MNIVGILTASAKVLVTSRVQSVDSTTLEHHTLSCIVPAESQHIRAVVRERLGKAVLVDHKLTRA